MLNTKQQSLQQLGEEYEKNAQLQQFFIEKCKRDIKKAEEQGKQELVLRLKSNLSVFYQIKRELSEIACKLKNYY